MLTHVLDLFLHMSHSGDFARHYPAGLDARTQMSYSDGLNSSSLHPASSLVQSLCDVRLSQCENRAGRLEISRGVSECNVSCLLQQLPREHYTPKSIGELSSGENTNLTQRVCCLQHV